MHMNDLMGLDKELEVWSVVRQVKKSLGDDLLQPLNQRQDDRYSDGRKRLDDGHRIV